MKYFPLQPTHKLLNKKYQAFSLIELTIMLALIMLIAALCVPSFTTYNKQSIAHEAAHIKATCHYLQQRAFAENKKFELVFDEKAKNYTGGGEHHTLSSRVNFGVAPHVLGPPNKPTSRLTRAITFPKNKITFYPQGTTAAGSVYLVDDTKKLLYAITIPVGNIPHIRIYDYHNGTWHAHT